MSKTNFCVYIISHGRPNNIYTISTLERSGYTGRVVIVIDDEDESSNEYIRVHGKQSVKIFNKEKIAATVDSGDNFNNRRTTTHARNAIWEIAKSDGVTHFIVLDDDYTSLTFRFDARCNYNAGKSVRNADALFKIAVNFLDEASQVRCLAFSQGGDFMGGSEGNNAEKVKTKRKVMNTFMFKTDRPMKFLSRLNEDVNTYLTLGQIGVVLLTTNQIAIQQMATQSNDGGMTNSYILEGTYVKSFYSVMYSPSSVTIKTLSGRIHHSIKWNNTVPKIIRASHRKEVTCGK